jgi:hypothetical protein
LYAELAKVREAQSSDHWLMGVQLLEWQLYLARPAVEEKSLPWQKQQGVEKRTPNRVMQSLPQHLWQVGRPVGEVRPRGKGKGWPKGKARPRPQKYKLVSKSQKKAANLSKKE